MELYLFCKWQARKEQSFYREATKMWTYLPKEEKSRWKLIHLTLMKKRIEKQLTEIAVDVDLDEFEDEYTVSRYYRV